MTHEQLKPIVQPKCYQSNPYQHQRRFEVVTDQERYTFNWMHVLYVTMNRTGTELTIELTYVTVMLEGTQLEKLYESLLKEELEWLKSLPAERVVPQGWTQPLIQALEVTFKGPQKPKRLYKTTHSDTQSDITNRILK